MKLLAANSWDPSDLVIVASSVKAISDGNQAVVTENIASLAIELLPEKPEEVQELEQQIARLGKAAAGAFKASASPLQVDDKFDVSLDKEVWRQALAEESFFPNFFVRAKSCWAALNQDPEQLWNTKWPESLLFEKEKEKPRVIFIGDTDVCLVGPFLSVIGGKFLQEWREHLPSFTSELMLKPSDLLARSEESRHWINFKLGDLTPIHFAIDASREAGGELGPRLRALLDRHCIHLSLIYLATLARKRPDQKGWTVTFALDDRRVEIPLGPLLPAGDKGEAARQLLEWVQVCYGAKEKVDADRLGHLRGILARELPREGARFEALLAGLGELERLRQQSWEVFIQRKMDEFFDKQASFEEKVTAAVERHQTIIDTLTKSLADDSKGAIAVVLGSMVTSLLDAKLEFKIFLAGAVLYGLYILVVQLFWGLGKAQRNFRGAQADFRRLRSRFVEILGERKVKTMVKGPMKRVETEFNRACRNALVGYQVILLLLAALVVYYSGLSWP